jgi:4-coumarate--CoA ligase
VLVYSGNTLFYPVLFMGILMAGGVFTGANPTYVPRELAHQLKDSGARFMVSSGASLEVALDAAGKVGFSKDNIFIFDDEIYQGSGASRLGVKYWDALVASNLEGSQFQWARHADPKSTTAVINYSSGTTGVAKGVEITHYNYMATSSQMIQLMEQDPDYEKNLKVARGLCVLPYDS